MPKTILIVEDCADAREMLADVLRLEGFTVVCACDGVAAVELLTDHLRPNAIVLDVQMPRMNGHEFLAWMRAHARAADVPVVAMSGAQVEVAGADIFLRKPLKLDTLASVLRSVISARMAGQVPAKSRRRVAACPMFAEFSVTPTLAVWKTLYCEGEFGECDRLKLFLAEQPVPPHLLPDGRMLMV